MTKSTPTPSTKNESDLMAILYWELPDVTARELADLAAAVGVEMEVRVGERLAALCSDEELDEFGELLDGRDDDLCAQWLREHIPQHSTIAEKEIEHLIAETVSTVEATGVPAPPVVNPKRRRRIERSSHALLLRALARQPGPYEDDGDGVRLEVNPRQGLSFRIQVILTEKGLFCARATYPEQIPLHLRPQLEVFVQEWNAATYFPKGYLRDDPEGCRWDLVAEFAVPVAPGLHGQLLDHFVAVATSFTSEMFEKVAEVLPRWAASQV